jgi:hypothetical protein
MFLTLLQSRGGPPPPPAPVGGGGGAALPRRRNRPEWEAWRAQERARLESLLRGEDTTPEIRQAVATLSKSAEPQALRVVRKLTAYSGELDQLRSLQRDIAKLELDIQQRRTADENYQALQQSAAELKAVIEEDEEFLVAYAELQQQEAELVVAALGGGGARLLS